jgi:nucleoside-triphosphatase THEP1
MMTSQDLWEQHPKLLIVTGEIGTGKTTWCQQWIDYAREQQARVCGLLSPALVQDGLKIGIQLVNLATREQRLLAWLRAGDKDNATGITTKRWRFDPDTLAWGDTVLQDITNTDVLIIDELGPLELEYGIGWQSALELINSEEAYGMACIVVRPALVPVALSRWPHALTLECCLR